MAKDNSPTDRGAQKLHDFVVPELSEPNRAALKSLWQLYEGRKLMGVD